MSMRVKKVIVFIAFVSIAILAQCTLERVANASLQTTLIDRFYKMGGNPAVPSDLEVLEGLLNIDGFKKLTQIEGQSFILFLKKERKLAVEEPEFQIFRGRAFKAQEFVNESNYQMVMNGIDIKYSYMVYKSGMMLFIKNYEPLVYNFKNEFGRRVIKATIIQASRYWLDITGFQGVVFVSPKESMAAIVDFKGSYGVINMTFEK